jgi:hypothetical protein
MSYQKRLRQLIILTFVCALGISSAAAQQEAKKDDKKAEAAPQGTPVLWADPGDISARDLYLGPGGEGMKPDLSNVVFVREEVGGYSPKFRVTDGSGKTWVAKMGKEAQPETAAVRLAWAIGYVTEVSYLVPCVKIKGAPAPRKEVARCEGDGFANVRFEARPDEWKRLEEWRWAENPFAGKDEFQGLVVLMGLINNWDLKDSNNKIIHVPERGELRYVISDLGATFGKTGNFITHDRNNPKSFVKSKFVERVEAGRVRFAYDGKMGKLFDNITVAQARWIGRLLAKLSDKQLADAFRAANYEGADLQMLVSEVRSRIDELNNLPAPAGDAVGSQTTNSPGKR